MQSSHVAPVLLTPRKHLECSLEEHTSSHEHDSRHQTSRVSLTQSNSSVAGGALSSGRRGGACARLSGRGHGHGAAGSGGRRHGIDSGGILGAAVCSLLTSLLATEVIGVSVDALAEVGLADIEGDGLDVWRDVGRAAVRAGAGEVERVLEKLLAG